MPCMPSSLGEHMDQDVEQFHVRAWPPGHVARHVDIEGRNRRVRVLPRSAVAVDDFARETGPQPPTSRRRGRPIECHRCQCPGNGRPNTSPKYQASEIERCLIRPRRLVPV